MSTDNPYTDYLANLDALLYVKVTDPDGFRARQIVLCCLTVYGMVVSLTYGIVIIYQYEVPQSTRSSPTSSATDSSHQHGSSATPDSRRRLWLVRRVDGYWCMNSHVLLPILGFISCAFMLTYAYLHYIVFRYHQRLGVATAFRPFAWIPMVMQGVLLTISAVQAYTIVVQRSGSDRNRSQHHGTESGLRRLRKRLTTVPGPRVFNALFAGLALLVLASLLATDIAFSVKWRGLWSAFVSLRSMLQDAEAKWSPTDSYDVLTLLTLNELRGKVIARRREINPIIRSVILVLIASALIMAVLNMGLGALYLLIRKQIRQSTKLQSRSLFNYQMSPTPVQEHAPGVPSFLSPVRVDSRSEPVAVRLPSASATSTDDKDEKTNTNHRSHIASASLGPGRRLNILATSFAMKPRAKREDVALRKSEVTFDGVPVSHIMDLAASDSLSDLKRAETELVIIFLCVGSLALMFASFNVWNYIWAYARPPDVVKWSDNELSYFFVPWAYCILYPFACTGLVINSLLSIRRRTLARRRASSNATLGLRRESSMWAAGMRRHSVAAELGRGRFGSAGEVRVEIERTTKVDQHTGSPIPGRRTTAFVTEESIEDLAPDEDER